MDNEYFTLVEKLIKIEYNIYLENYSTASKPVIKSGSHVGFISFEEYHSIRMAQFECNLAIMKANK